MSRSYRIPQVLNEGESQEPTHTQRVTAGGWLLTYEPRHGTFLRLQSCFLVQLVQGIHLEQGAELGLPG